MDLDWIISIAAFLVFVSWALFFYTNAVLPVQTGEQGSLLAVNQKVVDFLTVEVRESDIRVVATVANENSSVFFLTYPWSFGKNTTRVFNSSGGQLGCYMWAHNNTLYFRGNLTVGGDPTTNNYFKMRYRNESTAMNCTTSFAIVNESGVVAWPAKPLRLLSIAQITTMNTTAYDTFRQQLSVTRNFRVELNISGAVTTYGPNLPGASNVYATSVNSLVEETNQNATVRVMSW